MKLKLTALLVLILLSASFTANKAQEKDEYGYPIYKQLSEADMERLVWNKKGLFKPSGDGDFVKESIIRGNKITTILYNYGSICRPNTLGNIADLVWQGLGYGFEFGPLAAAEVVLDTATYQIVSDSFILTGQGDYSPDELTKWGWLPKPGFVDNSEGQNEIARLNIGDSDGDGKPDSWPESWYSAGAGDYIWPSFLGDEATAPDEEVYYVVDDYTNAEFPYYPFGEDEPDKRGLGLDMEVRVLQFNNAQAEDIMFLVYQITNASEKELTRAYFGMQGDPHVGGPADYADDRAEFIDPFGVTANTKQTFNQRARNMVFSWDEDGTGDGGRPAGYFGWKFLESPSNAVDGIDNDDDGITDESPDNTAGIFLDGVDNSVFSSYITDVQQYTDVYGEPRPRFEGDEDGDWNFEFDDLGIDGIGPNAAKYPGPDFGEGDGKPSQGWYFDGNGNGEYDEGEMISEERLPGYFWAGSEPNFGLRDVSESDQIGLSSFHAAAYTNSLPNVPKNDPLMWEWLSSDSISADQELLSVAGDNIFNFGTGPLALSPGESQRFSMAILFGNDLDQLVLNAEASTRILESDYRFAKPPEKPNVSAVAGDGKVTLYWDTASEESFDPFLRTFDFQGYKIYRSRDYTFADIKTITDGFGNPFLGDPIAQYDVVDSLSGFHPIEYVGRGVKYYMGDNSGLVHEYVDSTVQNGITYYYAVVAYDGGSIPFELAPSETQATIIYDTIADEFTFDNNTVAATPGPISRGFIDAEVGIGGTPMQLSGNSTGEIYVKILDPLKVPDKIYSIEFEEDELYNILDSLGVEESFTSKDTVLVELSNTNIKESSVIVRDQNGSIVSPDRYVLRADIGKIGSANSGDLPDGQEFTISYQYYPVYRSSQLGNQDGNPSFDGMRVLVDNEALDLDEERSGFNNPQNVNVKDSLLYSTAQAAYVGAPKVQYRADWEIRWNDLDTLNDGTWVNLSDTALAAPSLQPILAPFNIVNISENVPGEYIVDESNSDKGGNGQWDWGEPIILRPTGATGATVSYYVNFTLPEDEEPQVPGEGDIYTVRTMKPFQEGDRYVFESKAVSFSNQKAAGLLDEIYVVPNPYVAYSLAEGPGRTADKRGEREVQFRNLPQRCTIRIYTITGDLVDTIEKDDNTSIASWDLLSFEGQRVAYGVYIYHVDAPGVGEKIGRMALIK